MYTIKILTDRYIKWCDECWFETGKAPLYIFSYDEALTIVKQLKKHYIYQAELVSENGDSEIIDSITKKTLTEQPKKTITKLRLRI